ncbi:MAG: hypothetical protein VKK62_00545 [Synechococcaceae cyanobacterium]|nr:hypothetical protein [Synechococcaceae cyanobacterium]
MTRAPRRPGGRPPRLLHHIDALLTLCGSREVPHPASASEQTRERRRRQRLLLAQRLLDPLPRALQGPDHGPERFWQVLRWGGAGLLLACGLQWLASGPR